MIGIPLRRLVSVIGLTVAIVTAVATPCVYFIHDYANISAKLTFKAQLNAARVAQYIYTHNAMTSIRTMPCGNISSCGLPS